MIDRIRRLIDSIRRLFHKPTEDNLELIGEFVITDIDEETGHILMEPVEERMEEETPNRNRYTSLTRFTGRDVPTRTHGQPLEPLRRRKN